MEHGTSRSEGRQGGDRGELGNSVDGDEDLRRDEVLPQPEKEPPS